MACNKLSIKDIDLQGKLVFCRVDFNVPINAEGKITDDTRIVKALPTIQYMIAKGAKVVLASHLGRPKGQKNPEYSLKPVAKRLMKLLHTDVKMAEDCIGPEVEAMKQMMKPGDVLLLENVRFEAEEEKNGDALAQEFAKNIDVFVNDAFGTAHRAHASTAGIAKFVPVSVAGFLLITEVTMLGEALAQPKRPFTAIIGGAKISDKILVIDNLLDRVDKLMIGGGMANTFLKALGYELGKSLVEDERISIAQDMIAKAKSKKVELLLPTDVTIAKEFSADTEYRNAKIEEIPADWMALDIGRETIELYTKAIQESATIIWNGPMGVFELEPFAIGTSSVAKALADHDAFTIVGGGDSVAAVEHAGLADKMDHISTGGGASLNMLEGKRLPGVEILNDRLTLRKPIIAANWKMFKTIAETEVYIDKLMAKELPKQVDIVLCPPFTGLESAAMAVTGTEIKIGAQNMHFEASGAYTGEISPVMLGDLNVQYVILGHSERRKFFHETNEIINKKVHTAFKYDLTPILCVGETIEEKEAGKTLEVLKQQIDQGIAWLTANQVAKMVIAYEPVWAIGTGKSPTPADANDSVKAIRKYIQEIYDMETAQQVRIQYGGSVKPENIKDFLTQSDIDGALVGGASLAADSFYSMLV
ncbi:triose-phosphate isomerase [Desulfuribacillus stibiiarsenatis]|uniref:Multifunctional fusion protein n=1 Tax=Desulfuribacillus stibiiarsenatis TaxID=1390249 RepID=A0A1E5L9J8_9FIRM|nr:triose-phosphate isomerase [Desulfuribacillus stibiiarsenatis]OEH86822.1 triose-phosphate isomerase [Desulfuribacillus stibiiarsenatis]